MRNSTTITLYQPEDKFLYYGHLFFQTANTYNSDIDWDITTKFGLLHRH